MADLELPIPYQVTNPIPVDKYYGPYASTTAANSAVTPVLRSVGAPGGVVVGRTVGIVIGGTPKEYWWYGGTGDDKLVEKTSGSGTTIPTTTGYDLFTAGEYQSVGEPSTDSADFALDPQLGRTASNTPFDIEDAEGEFTVDFADTGLQYYYVPIILTDGTLDKVEGAQAVSAVYPTTFPGNTGSILTAILVTDHDAVPVNRKVGTALQNPVTLEIRRGDKFFEADDNTKALIGENDDEYFDLFFQMFQDTPGLTPTELVRTGDGKRQIGLVIDPDLFGDVDLSNYLRKDANETTNSSSWSLESSNYGSGSGGKLNLQAGSGQSTYLIRLGGGVIGGVEAGDGFTTVVLGEIYLRITSAGIQVGNNVSSPSTSFRLFGPVNYTPTHDEDFVQKGTMDTAISDALSGLPGGGIPDAPSDGTIYGRKDGDWVAGTGGASTQTYVDVFVATAGQTAFSLAHTPTTILFMSAGGAIGRSTSPADYTVSGANLTLTETNSGPIEADAEVRVVYTVAP